ncbi:MAG: DNA-processing protein DprA [Patescibacteria group bacterium]
MDDLPYWVALNQIPCIGAKRFRQLLNHFGSAEEAFRAPLQALQEAGIGPHAAQVMAAEREKIEPGRELMKAAREGVEIVTLQSPSYPRLLARIPDPPPVLYVRGSLLPEDGTAVAIVGARAATVNGRLAAEKLAGDLARQGVTIVSGMARGIDSAAHQGALRSGGRTIAVLGSGLDVIYPPENNALYRQIAGNGAVISEFPLGTEPLQMNFPARNRIISGLSLGVVVVEASHDSGSLITAGHALEQGREVFAVPGAVDQEGSRGPHRLIKQGAKLVEDAGDILEELSLPVLSVEEVAAARTPVDLSPEEEKILQTLGHEPRHVDLVVRDSGLASGVVGAALVMLEMKGLVRQWAGGLFSRLR